MLAGTDLTPFAQLVRKEGAGLGSLGRAQLLSVWALVWSMLPPGCVVQRQAQRDERQARHQRWLQQARA